MSNNVHGGVTCHREGRKMRSEKKNAVITFKAEDELLSALEKSKAFASEGTTEFPERHLRSISKDAKSERMY